MADSAKYKLTINLDNGYKFDCGTFEVPYAPTIVDVGVTSTEDDGYTIQLTMSDGAIIESEEFTLDAVATKINARMYAVGYNDGYIHGKDVGYEEGHSVGYEEGYSVGYEEGYEAGGGGVKEVTLGWYLDYLITDYDGILFFELTLLLAYMEYGSDITPEIWAAYKAELEQEYCPSSIASIYAISPTDITLTINEYIPYIDEVCEAINAAYTRAQFEAIIGEEAPAWPLPSVSLALDKHSIMDMAGAFYNATSLTELCSAWGTLDTSKVTTLYETFCNCMSLTSVDALASWDTSKVTTLYEIFCNCISLTSVDALASWDTSKVTTLYYTFRNCSSLTNVDALASWDTSKVTTLYRTFYYCSKLTNVDALANWDTSKVTTLIQTFYNCSSLTSVTLGTDLSAVTNMTNTFYNCSKLARLVLNGLRVSFSISVSTAFTEEALVELINSLGTPSSTATLTMGSTNLAKLTDEEKAIATDKGWTLA